MDKSLVSKPRVCFEVEKIIGISSDGNYQVQWAPVWVSRFHLIGCEHLIQEFLQQQAQQHNDEQVQPHLPQQITADHQSGVVEPVEVGTCEKNELESPSLRTGKPDEAISSQADSSSFVNESAASFQPGCHQGDDLQVKNHILYKTNDNVVKIEDSDDDMDHQPPETTKGPSMIRSGTTVTNNNKTQQENPCSPGRVFNTPDIDIFDTHPHQVPQHGTFHNTPPSTQHSPDSLQPCPICKKLFRDVERHIRTHTHDKPFACEFCSKSFAQRSTLKTHIRIHTGEKPFICKSCGKGFAQLNSLNWHKSRCNKNNNT